MEPVSGIEPPTCCLRMVTAADLKTSKNKQKGSKSVLNQGLRLKPLKS